MKLLLIDPNLSLESPSMKGVIRSLRTLRQAGWVIEGWCWDCDARLPIDRVVRLPRLGNVRGLRGHAFGLWARLWSWWAFRVRKEPRPDLVYTVAWYFPDCDVCHVHFSPWDWERRQRQIGVHSLRDLAERMLSRLGLRSARRFLARTGARRILAVSRAVADDVRAAAPALRSRVVVLPNSYDPARFHPGVRAEWREVMRAGLGFGAADPVFIFVSTGHYRRKGFLLAAGAVALLRSRGSKSRLLVVGGSEPGLAGLARGLDRRHPGWRSWIRFAGMVADVEKYFAAADALLFPSYCEAFALVEVEAAACGLPLFLTRHGGSEMILDDGVNGRFIEFDAGAIASVLAEFVSGRWRPTRTGPLCALDSEAYARRLAAELDLAQAPMTPPEGASDRRELAPVS